MKLNNKYYILRHGEALSNVKDFVSSWPEKFKNPLTQKGKSQIKIASEKLKNKKIDLIFTSPLLRTKQTSEIIGKKLKIKPKPDKRLREYDFGVFNNKSAKSFMGYFKSSDKRTNKKVPGGENFKEVSKRMLDFLKEINGKYKGKNILIVSHQCPLFLLKGNIMGLSLDKAAKNLENITRKGEIRELN